jgi:hypothetical protein
VPDSFDSSTIENAYESQIYPAMISTLLGRSDIEVIKRLYQILYVRVQSESADFSKTIIAWMQPPQAMLETAMYGLADMIVNQYQSMVESISRNQVDEEILNEISKNKPWPKQHAIVVGLRCEITEFCELVWRMFKNNLTGQCIVSVQSVQSNVECVDHEHRFVLRRRRTTRFDGHGFPFVW